MFEFGKRSLAKMGSSRGITLPKEWLDYMKPVAIKLTLDSENNLILTPIPATVSEAEARTGGATHTGEKVKFEVSGRGAHD